MSGRASGWTCKRRSCATRNPPRTRKCGACGKARGSTKTKHEALLDEAREQYDALLAIQAGRCALCPSEPSERRRLDIDHDHERMLVRGLLCPRCNRALPSWMTPEWLRGAAEYLERTSVESNVAQLAIPAAPGFVQEPLDVTLDYYRRSAA